jgi:hypothetical protein
MSYNMCGVGSDGSDDAILHCSPGATCRPWDANQFPMFEVASGSKLMGVVAGGGHNLGRTRHMRVCDS